MSKKHTCNKTSTGTIVCTALLTTKKTKTKNILFNHTLNDVRKELVYSEVWLNVAYIQIIAIFTIHQCQCSKCLEIKKKKKKSCATCKITTES